MGRVGAAKRRSNAESARKRGATPLTKNFAFFVPFDAQIRPAWQAGDADTSSRTVLRVSVTLWPILSGL